MDESRQKIEDKLLDILSKEILSISELSRRLNVKRYILAGYLEALREQGKVDVFKVGKAKVYVAKGKLIKRLQIFFFLLLIPFLLPIPSLAQIEVNLSSEKIWILETDNRIIFIPEVLEVTTNCSTISSAYLNSSNIIKWIDNEVDNNYLNFETSILKDLISPTARYFLQLDCETEFGSLTVVKELNVSYLRPYYTIVSKDFGNQSLYEGSEIFIKLSLIENDRYVNVLDIRRESIVLKVNNDEIQFNPTYNLNKREIEIPVGKISSGTHTFALEFSYKDLPTKILVSGNFKVEKRIKINIISPNPPYLLPNSTLVMRIDTPITSLEAEKLSVSISNKNTEFILDGKTVRISSPQLQPGEYMLRVCYDGFCDSTKVFYVTKISGKILDDSNKPIFTKFTFFKNGTQVISFNTDSTGAYNIALPPDYYDLKVDFPKATVVFKDFKFEENEGLINHIYKDFHPIKGIRVYGFYYFEFSGDYSSIELELKYDKSRVEDEDKMKVFYCKNWNFATSSCNSNWEYPTFSLDKVNSKVSLILNSLSAIVLGREISLKVSCSLNKKSFYVNESAFISCLVEDEDGNVIENATVTLNFPSETKFGKTDKNGIVTLEYSIPSEGSFNVTVYAEKVPYSKARSYISFSAERKKEIFISFPDLIKPEIGSNFTIEFSIVNTGQSDLNDIKIYLESIPFDYVLSTNHISNLLPAERINILLTIFIPENSTIATYSPRIKVVSKEIESTKNFGMTLLKLEKPKPQSGFVVKIPTLKLDSIYIYLTLFAALSFSLAYVLKRLKKRNKKISYDDIFNLIGGMA